jgi:hypothetical protein
LLFLFLCYLDSLSAQTSLAPTYTMRNFIVSLLAAATTVYGYADPMGCSGVCTNAHDPALIRRESDGRYYRFSTGGKIAIHSARSIVGPWTYIGAAIPNGSKINLNGKNDLWVNHTPFMNYLKNTQLTKHATRRPTSPK